MEKKFYFQKKELKLFSFLNKMRKVLVPQKHLSSYHFEKNIFGTYVMHFFDSLVSKCYLFFYSIFLRFFFKSFFFLKFPKKVLDLFLELKLFSSYFKTSTLKICMKSLENDAFLIEFLRRKS